MTPQQTKKIVIVLVVLLIAIFLLKKTKDSKKKQEVSNKIDKNTEVDKIKTFDFTTKQIVTSIQTGESILTLDSTTDVAEGDYVEFDTNGVKYYDYVASSLAISPVSTFTNPDDTVYSSDTRFIARKETGINYIGYDIDNVTGGTLKDALERAIATPGCIGFGHEINANRYWFKYALNTNTGDNGRQSFAGANFYHLRPNAVPKVVVEYNTNYPGGDVYYDPDLLHIDAYSTAVTLSYCVAYALNTSGGSKKGVWFKYALGNLTADNADYTQYFTKFYEDGGFASKGQEHTFAGVDIEYSKNTLGFNISSMRIPKGIRVQAYSAENFGGDVREYTSDMSTLGDFNDKIRSFRILRAVGLTNNVSQSDGVVYNVDRRVYQGKLRQYVEGVHTYHLRYDENIELVVVPGVTHWDGHGDDYLTGNDVDITNEYLLQLEAIKRPGCIGVVVYNPGTPTNGIVFFKYNIANGYSFTSNGWDSRILGHTVDTYYHVRQRGMPQSGGVTLNQTKVSLESNQILLSRPIPTNFTSVTSVNIYKQFPKDVPKELSFSRRGFSKTSKESARGSRELSAVCPPWVRKNMFVIPLEWKTKTIYRIAQMNTDGFFIGIDHEGTILATRNSNYDIDMDDGEILKNVQSRNISGNLNVGSRVSVYLPERNIVSLAGSVSRNSSLAFFENYQDAFMFLTETEYSHGLISGPISPEGTILRVSENRLSFDPESAESIVVTGFRNQWYEKDTFAIKTIRKIADNYYYIEFQTLGLSKFNFTSAYFELINTNNPERSIFKYIRYNWYLDSVYIKYFTNADPVSEKSLVDTNAIYGSYKTVRDSVYNSRIQNNMMSSSEVERAYKLFGPLPVIDIMYPSQTPKILNNENVSSFSENPEIFEIFKSRLLTIKSFLIARSNYLSDISNSQSKNYVAQMSDRLPLIDNVRKEITLLVTGDNKIFKNGGFFGTCRTDCKVGDTEDACFMSYGYGKENGGHTPCTDEEITNGSCLRTRLDRSREIPYLKQNNGLYLTRIFVGDHVYVFTVDKTYPYISGINMYVSEKTGIVSELSEIVAKCENPDDAYACFLDASKDDSCDYINNMNFPMYSQKSSCYSDPTVTTYQKTIYNIFKNIMAVYEVTCLTMQARDDPYEVWGYHSYRAEKRCKHRDSSKGDSYPKPTIGKCRSAYDNIGGVCVLKSIKISEANCVKRTLDPNTLLTVVTSNESARQMPNSIDR